MHNVVFSTGAKVVQLYGWSSDGVLVLHIGFCFCIASTLVRDLDSDDLVK